MPHPLPSGAAGPPAAAGLLDSLLSIARELPGLLSDRVELLALELRRAGVALAQIVALIVAAAILGVTAWFALWSAVVLLLVLNFEWHWALALLLVGVLNLAAIWFALVRARALAPLLSLPATQRHLTVKPAPPSGDALAGIAS
jgi:hypothetical protein